MAAFAKSWRREKGMHRGAAPAHRETSAARYVTVGFVRRSAAH